jgi:hypothetical protein
MRVRERASISIRRIDPLSRRPMRRRRARCLAVDERRRRRGGRMVMILTYANGAKIIFDYLAARGLLGRLRETQCPLKSHVDDAIRT